MSFYFVSLAAGGVIFYQYFSSIHYLPTIEVSMIFWAVLFVASSAESVGRGAVKN